MKTKILIIDDDEKLSTLLSEYLARFNFEVRTAGNSDEGLKEVHSENPDIIILDVMLPGMNGFEVCKEIRKESSIPIIMLTARGEVTDRIVGLELGADDYLPKPFEPRELVARIQSILRRTNESKPESKIEFDKLSIDLEKQTVRMDGEYIELTTMEFEMLSVFAKNPGKVFSRERLMELLRGIDWDAYDRSIDVLISRLRQKLNDNPKQPRYIKTIWGSGYKFIGD
jgi:two-component system phosphate regulon response regulator OmpR